MRNGNGIHGNETFPPLKSEERREKREEKRKIFFTEVKKINIKKKININLIRMQN